MGTLFQNGLALAVLFLITGCTTTRKYNEPLTEYIPDAGYRFNNIEAGDNTDSLFVILTFSGGGTRASALSLGVLEKLASIEIEWEGHKERLLDEVDLISSVSGGSFTSAYYGLFGDRIFNEYADLLYNKNQSILLRSAFSLPNMVKQSSPLYSRTDTAANSYDNNLFEGKTFGDLLEQNKRPFILINSTDMGIGRQFSFTQNYFDLLYSDLSTYPIGYAVTASSAFPGAFPSMMLNNYNQGEDFELDPWYAKALEENLQGTGPYREAKFTESYLNPEKSYLHLSDGGVSDNLGLLPIIHSISMPGHPSNMVPIISDEKEQKILIIAVNAAAISTDEMSYKKKPIGFIKSLSRAGTTPLDWFSEALLAYSQLMINYIESSENSESLEASVAPTNADRSKRSESKRKFYFVEVGFDDIEDDETREFFQSIPTKFTLPQNSITRLREVGGIILENDPVFQELMEEIQTNK